MAKERCAVMRGEERSDRCTEIKLPARILLVTGQPQLSDQLKAGFLQQIREGELCFEATESVDLAREELLTSDDIDIAIVDMDLPKAQTFLQALTDTAPAVKTIAIARQPSVQDVRQAMSCGAFDLIPYPFDVDDLRATVFRSLAHARRVRATLQELQIARQRLEYDAYHDVLTGLPNRAYCIKRLQRAIALAQAQPDYCYAVMFVEVDRLGIVNDSLGHLVGDRLLADFARRLRAILSFADAVARFGGDSFIVFLESVNTPDDAIAIARRVQEQLHFPFTLNNYQIFTSATIGITMSANGYTDVEAILQDANTALYHAKAKRPGTYQLFTTEMEVQARARLELERDLRQAIARREFCLVYQPIVALANPTQIVGFEALLRWNSIRGAGVNTDEIVRVAEETGLIDPIGLWVLQAAIAQIEYWRREVPGYPQLSVNANVSMQQFLRADLVGEIERMLAEAKVSASHLKLEITESCLAGAAGPGLDSKLSRLRELGLRLCVDDFGTGYSSLSRLHEFPVDTIKVDRSFVTHMESYPAHREIARAIVRLAHTLGMSVVAEGIETEAQRQILLDMGCEFGQGFLFSRPLAAEEATHFLKKSRLMLVAKESAPCRKLSVELCRDDR